MNAKARIRKYLRYKDIRDADFKKTTGLSNGYLKGESIQSNKLAIIGKHYLDLNLKWIITGEGEMLLPAKKITDNSTGTINNVAHDEPQPINNSTQLIAELKKKVEELEKLVNTLEKLVETLQESNRDKNEIIKAKDDLIQSFKDADQDQSKVTGYGKIMR